MFACSRQPCSTMQQVWQPDPPLAPFHTLPTCALPAPPAGKTSTSPTAASTPPCPCATGQRPTCPSRSCRWVGGGRGRVAVAPLPPTAAALLRAPLTTPPLQPPPTQLLPACPAWLFHAGCGACWLQEALPHPDGCHPAGPAVQGRHRHCRWVGGGQWGGRWAMGGQLRAAHQ
jgi:hypothetical protein